jgi:DNA-binding MarR family transcriptional regulator
MRVEPPSSSNDADLLRKWVGVSARDLELIKGSRSILEPQADLIAREFYDAAFEILEFTEIAERSGTSRQRLEALQKAYFLSLLDATVDQAHIDRRLKIGARHAELGIEPGWVISLYNLYIRIIPELLAKELSGEELQETRAAWSKLIQLDTALLVEGYTQETNGPYGSVLDLLFLSSQFRSRVDNVLAIYSKEEDLSSTEVLTLLWLRRESSTVSELATAAGLQANSMTILIDRLSKRDLVARRRSRQDRRVVFVSLTPAGEECAVRIGGDVETAINHLLSHLSVRERTEFASTLSRMALPQQ